MNTKAVKSKIKLSFQPRQVVKRLLAVLSPRGRDVLESRYGLGKNEETMTLESIGKLYKITRERVRQIENYSVALIQKSDAYKKEKVAFDEMKITLKSLGGIIAEDELLDILCSAPSIRNAVHFLLVIGEPFKLKKEDVDFHHRWYVDDELMERIERSLKNLYEGLSDKDIIPESEMI
ncbi:MAG: sigma factor-like helix-turn-helix DNA-binding protein, partial [Patescibacteria group bacterium]